MVMVGSSLSKGSSFYPTAKGGAGTNHIKGDFTLSVRLSSRQGTAGVDVTPDYRKLWRVGTRGAAASECGGFAFLQTIPYCELHTLTISAS
jgi:hypothetical protein